MRVALLGTGTMGLPMARRLAAAGLSVSVWNRTRRRAEPLAVDGISVAETPAGAAKDADALLTVLADANAVEAAVSGPQGALAVAREGAVWVQMSTVGVAGCERLAALAGEHPVTYVDAPVLGSRAPAETGDLVMLASGPEEAQGRCAPLFDAVGRRTLWLGPAGAGSRLKVVLNAWLMAMTATLAETVALAEALGVDFGDFLDATDRAQLAAAYTEQLGVAMGERAFEPVGFPLALARKDAALALEAAADGAARLQVFAATERQYGRAVEMGHGDEDWAAVVRAALSE